MNAPLFFADWSDIARVAAGALLAYPRSSFLRLSGKRTLAKLNAFDLVITVVLGSTLASVILPSRPSLADGILALALLVVLQYCVAWLQVRSSGLRDVVKNRPTLLLKDGEATDDALRRERITRDELLAALRNAGCGDSAGVAAAVLETDGSISVLPARGDAPRKSTLADVDNARG
ncbi:MAG: DUF421 domain-containing protein [Gammaproteobacteria bacterium]|nr:DUF421 domain-containing protein [Gammaproteobacteria bacterium]